MAEDFEFGSRTRHRSADRRTMLGLLDNVKKTGNSIIVTRKGEPIAQVNPPPPQPKKDQWLGFMKDRIKITGDIIAPASDEKDWEDTKIIDADTVAELPAI